MTKLLFLIFAAGLVYLNNTNPTREEHEKLLLAELQGLGPISEEQFDRALQEIDFSNFMICSASKTSMDSRMISVDYLKKTRLINDQWVKQTQQKLQGSQG